MPKDGYYLPQRRLVSQDDAAVIESANVPRSRFISQWTRKTAFDAGYLVPILIDEILPGDHMKYTITAYIRMSTPLFPMFDNQRVDTFFFFVPNRLVWDNWVRFMGQQDNPGDSIAYTVPALNLTRQAIGSIYDHMGLPNLQGQFPTSGSQAAINAMPLRGYNLIYNQWYRDQNIVNSVTVRKTDTGDVEGDYTLLKRAKSHDYFTSALPWPQKFTAPNIPLLGSAPVAGIGVTNETWNTTPTAVYETPLGAGVTRNYTLWRQSGDSANQHLIEGQSDGGGTHFWPKIYADLTQATGVAINQLRQAWMIQSLLERDARGGTRYTELLKSHFGVTNPDFRLQRAEYIGGGQSQLTLTPVAQTAPTTGVPLGALGAAGTAMGQHQASYAATEHGFVIGLINVRSELSYQQGLHKMWTRSTRYDYYWPALAQLGEQAILRQELYCVGDNTVDRLTFGYQERWHEYRVRTSEVTGIMRSFATGGLGAWHLAQQFATAPTLNQTFIEDTPPMSRILAAGDLAAGQQYLADIMYHREAVRPIPTYGTPANLGRF